jgi:undecaprenyl-diphosphatase
MSMLWVAIILGIVEGLTEFLPISSTGHLIITSDLIGFTGMRAETYEIFIQLGAILAVVWEYRTRLLLVAADVPRRASARGFVMNLFLAFLPAAVIGLLFHDYISEHLFSVPTVGAALIAGAVLILIVEALPLKPGPEEAEEIGWKQALGVGFAQCLALWPGFSRSAATILGGLGIGLNRKAATEFSFFLAIPTMFAATIYSLLKNLEYLEAADAGWLALSFVISFLVAWVSIRWLLRYVMSHSFRIFAWYRIGLGIIIFVYHYSG